MFNDLLNQIPFEIHVVAGIALAAGTIMWAFGHRLLRPMLVLAGLVIGAAVGFIASGFISHQVPALVIVLVVAAIFGALSMASYRFVMSGLLAACLAVAFPMGYYTYTEMTGQYEGQPGEPISTDEIALPLGEEQAAVGSSLDRGDAVRIAREELQRQWEKLSKDLKDMMPGGSGDSGTGGDVDVEGESSNESASSSESSGVEPSWRTHWRKTVELVGSEARIRWKDAPAGQKWGMVFAGVLGAVGGFLAGMIVPSASSAIVTAVAGAGIMMTSVLWLGTRIGIPEDWLKPSSATTVLVVWLIVAFLGVVVQLVLRSRAKNKADNT